MKLFKNSWDNILDEETNKLYFQKIGEFLKQERLKGKKIYPDSKDYFKVFQLTSFNEVKVVLLGQDAYFTKGVADGLAFSNKKELYLPPSLKSIFNEIETIYYDGFILEQDSNLDRWAKQGVFLLNKYLSVEDSLPLSHSRIGWEEFTNFVISELSNKRERLIFLLLGAKAQQVEKLIDTNKHLIIKAEHPASAAYNNRRWKANDCFNKINNYLKENNKQVIKW